MRRPFLDINIAGQPSGLSLGYDIQDFTYTDHLHGRVDEITMTLADPAGRYRGPWGIDEGTVIIAQCGYQAAPLFPCGQFAVDEHEALNDGDGDLATFKALSAFTSNALRTERSAGFDDMSLSAIVETVAVRHDLRVVGDIPPLSFARVSQKKETDLQFLTRLAEAWGCYFTCKGDRLTFTSRASLETQEPVAHFEATSEEITGYVLRRATKGLYSRATQTYIEPKTGETLSAQALDARISSGDTLKVDERAESEAHAKARCAAELAKQNDALCEGSQLTMTGAPHMMAGLVIALGPTFGRYQGRYLIHEAAHMFGSEGYKTRLYIGEVFVNE